MCLVDLYVFVGAWGGPGLTRRSLPKSIYFPHRFFDGFLMDFGSMFDHFFDDFSMFFASLVRDHFFMFFVFFESIFEPREP